MIFACLLMVSSCSAPVGSILSMETVDPGAMCVPRGIDQANIIAIDIIKNTSDGEVVIDGLSLDSATGIELLSSRVQKDLGAGGTLVYDGKQRGPFQPAVLAPGERALLEVVLRGTTPDSFGWANGMWVNAKTPQAHLRIHTCFTLIVAPGDDCGKADEPGTPGLDDDALRGLCGRTERVRGLQG